MFVARSRTGKTRAAPIAAREDGLGSHLIGRSWAVSKYPGETEKNLVRRTPEAPLLLDEADALFGKRPEMAERHDRCANTEVDYLLQRVEAYGGGALLTTNL